MRADCNGFLIFGAVGSAIAAILHVGCIVFGASWYRFFGAGEEMAQLAEAGSAVPTRMTSGIVLVLTIWTYCALAGVGMVPKPPLLRFLLSGIALVYLARALMFFALMKIMPGRSLEFWLVSSAVCLILGLAFFIGTKQSWDKL